MNPEQDNTPESSPSPVDRSTPLSTTRKVIQPLAPVRPEATQPPAPTPAPAQESPQAIPQSQPLTLSPTPPPQEAPQQPQAPAAVPVQQPAVPQSGPVVSDFAPIAGQTPPSEPPKKKSKKKLFVLTGSVALVVLLAAAAVFGLYLPNTPDNAYKTGFSRSGKALEQISGKITQQDTLTSFEQSKIAATIDVDASGQKFTGNLTTDFDDKSSKTSVDFTSEGDESVAIKAQLLSELADGKLYPDVYFKVAGFAPFGLDAFVPGISAYDDKWISVDSDYIEQNLASLGEIAASTDKSNMPTSKDLSELAGAFFKPTNEYVFTSNTEKAVFTKKSFVGKEKADDMTLYHYTVTINDANAMAYCVALSNSVLSTAAYKRVSGNDDAKIKDQIADAKEDCQKDSKKDSDWNDTYDLWIDGKYKLIHKFRVTDKDSKDNYVELGQTYKGGDDLNFFTNVIDKERKLNVRVDVDANLKKLTTTAKLKGSMGEGDSAVKVTGSLSATANKEKVTVDVPKDATPIKNIIEQMTGSSQPIEL